MTRVLPLNLYRADQVRELDRRAIEDHGIDSYALMQRASEAAWNLAQQRWPDAGRLWVLCGPGNNGGDGLVLARLALAAGREVEVLLLSDPDSYRGAAAEAMADLQRAGARPRRFDAALLENMCREADLIVDGLLGTGLSRPVEGDFLATIEAVQTAAGQGAGVLALDIPSGLQADTGAVMGQAVRADACITFIGMKLGLVTAQGPACCGELHFDDLAVSPAVYADLPPAALRISDELRFAALPRRNRSAHKGHYGHVHCVGGDAGTGGAIRIAAEAALRSGAGLVSVSTRSAAAAAMAQACPELMASGIEQDAGLPQHARAANVLLLGPGLGQADWGRSLWEQVLALDTPLVLDADGLNLLAEAPRQRDNWILTPHPGEAARLLGCSSAEVQADRPAAIAALQAKYGGVVVLKGAGSLVLGPDRELQVCTEGNPGMAVGGMGDLLGGIIAGLLAQGLAPGTAARLAVWLHATAADKAAAEHGERGLLPSGLYPYLRHLINP